MLQQEELDQIIGQIVDRKNIFSAVMRVENEDSTLSLSSAAGMMRSEDRFFIASITKLYITAVCLILEKQGKLDLEDKIEQFFEIGTLDKIHVYQGKDYSSEITIRHLISNTSGIPDYFFGKNDQGKTGSDDLLAGNDVEWTLEKTLDLVKNIKPKFKPGQKGKVEYSDTNFQLLGKILEKISGHSVRDLLQELVFEPLGLTDTYVFSDPNDHSPAAMYYRQTALHLPRYMASIPAEGGIVSTAEECMVFLKAFFNGFFFDKKRIEELKQWRFMLLPATMFFGIGLEMLWTPWFMSPGKKIRNIIGFWGQTGSFAFYHQDSGQFFTGTTNQINGRGHNAAYKAIIKIIRKST